MVRDPRRVKVVPICHPKGCRSYVIVDPTSREACVVDPLLDRVAETMRVLGDEGASPRWIVDTHSHADHLSGAAALRERTGAEVIMHPAAPSEVATVRPADGDQLPLGDTTLRIRHAPGNTPDAIVVDAAGALFTGDTLLIGTVGLRDAPGADAAAWFQTLHRLFDTPPDATVVHPGHDDMGRTMTTLRQERAGNGWLREDDLEAFEDRFGGDDRPPCPEAAEILAANREGRRRPARDLPATSGYVDPAHARAAAAAKGPAWERDASDPTAAALLPAGPLLVGGALVVLGTLLGWLLHPLCHALAGLTGVGLLAIALRPPAGRRKARAEPELFYEGPVRKSITG